MNEHELIDQLYAQYSKLPSVRKSNAVIYDQIMGFYHAVSWTSDASWLAPLLVFHVLFLLGVVLGRRFFYLQVFLFAYGCSSILLLEHANRLAREHWRVFATQNYFDEHGVFLSVVFAIPVLVVLSVQLVLLLKDAAQLVVQVKRHELKQKTSRKKDE